MAVVKGTLALPTLTIGRLKGHMRQRFLKVICSAGISPALTVYQILSRALGSEQRAKQQILALREPAFQQGH